MEFEAGKDGARWTEDESHRFADGSACSFGRATQRGEPQIVWDPAFDPARAVRCVFRWFVGFVWLFFFHEHEHVFVETHVAAAMIAQRRWNCHCRSGRSC